MGFYVRNYSGYNMGRFMALFPCVTENDRGCGSLFIFSPHILILIISPFAHRLQVFFPLSNSPLSFFFAHLSSLYYYLDSEFYYLINSSFFPHSPHPLEQLFTTHFSLLYAISPFMTAGGKQDFHKIYIN